MYIIDLHGKIAIITGSSRGIGYGIAERLARAGATVFVNGRTLGLVSKAVQSLSADAVAYPLVGDATDEQFVKASVKKIVSEHKKIDILINTVGAYARKKIEDVTQKDINAIVSANLLGIFYWTREVVPHMKQERSGKIISISSVAGVLGREESPLYNAAKGGIAAMTRGLGKDLGPFNITVNAIAPGLVPTELTKTLPHGTFEHNKKRTPLGRLGTADDVGKMVLFLASPLSDFVTGQTLVVDGGYSL